MKSDGTDTAHRIIAWILFAALGLVFGSVARSCHGAEPLRKPVLWLALDDSPQSMMLERELCRDWTKPNPAIRLTVAQWQAVARRGFRFNAVQWEIRRQFDVRFVGRDVVPVAYRAAFPMIRVGRGPWESIDKRAFAFESRPLLTVEWRLAMYAHSFNQQIGGRHYSTPDGFPDSWVPDECAVTAQWETTVPKTIRGAIVPQPVSEWCDE